MTVAAKTSRRCVESVLVDVLGHRSARFVGSDHPSLGVAVSELAHAADQLAGLRMANEVAARPVLLATEDAVVATLHQRQDGGQAGAVGGSSDGVTQALELPGRSAVGFNRLRRTM